MPIMLPNRPAQLFRSRWSAIFWAAGVVFFAVTTIGFSHHDAKAEPGKKPEVTDALGTPVTDEDLKVLRDLIK